MEKTKTSPLKVRRKTIEARDMIEDLHVFTEKINMSIAQDSVFNLGSKVDYTQIELGSGTSHIFRFGKHTITIDLHTDA